MPLTRLIPSLVGIILLNGARLVAADSYTLEELESDARPRMTTVQVAIEGSVVTSGGAGKTQRHNLAASAAYRFHERRLTGAGRDAKAFRAVRAFTQAAVRTRISDRVTDASLSPTLRLIAVNGSRQGLIRYAPNALLTRDSLDLLDMPGDPLAIVALLPDRQVAVGDTWKPADWAVQMLTAIEAAEESSLECTLDSVDGDRASVSFTGRMAGVRLGAPTNIELAGGFVYHLTDKLIISLTLNHTEKAAIGTVTPGVDSKVGVTVERSLAEANGGLTDALLESVSLEPPPARLPLILDAAPWGLRLVHDRGWHVFHANYDSEPKVCILRLLDHGSLICQCNFAPVPAMKAGTHTPLEEYEASIRQALGDQFGEFTERSNVPTDDGRKIFRVTALGNYSLPDGNESRTVPMSWTYYLVAHPSGRQVSFVFAVEPGLRDRLAERDVRLVESLLFEEPVP